ncbi:peptidoglycan-associated lipoprotein Pal [Lysobacter sp. SG-8]|uniref:Peptidoglycan-associated protein n=1 Tax=Marilutibacter penaei TaxID=2759900 RepID=A0A7W3U3Z9_9GAMM|nr:peptidoglycan-associated lipoprotein Pal [Lysobacter penaei]MBB1088536.1 peptidoglycan-associated lipoprotein Pal [Lysobacter penaei]
MNSITPATLGKTLLAVALCTTVVACSSNKKKEEVPPQVPTTTTPTAPVQSNVYSPEDLDTDACLRQRTVYFDLDQDSLRPEFQAIVSCHAKYLRDRPTSRMTLEGNADERGSRDYNVGLGERRGNAVSSALQASGGNGSQTTVVSYGEERPVCTDSSEDCWAKNRRVEIVYTAK